MRLPLEDGKTIAWLASIAEIMSKQYNDDHALVHCRMPSSAAGKLAGSGADIRVISGKIPVAAEKDMPDSATFMPSEENATASYTASDLKPQLSDGSKIGEVA